MCIEAGESGFGKRVLSAFPPSAPVAFESVIPNPKPKLLDRLREIIRLEIVEGGELIVDSLQTFREGLRKRPSALRYGALAPMPAEWAVVPPITRG